LLAAMPKRARKCRLLAVIPKRPRRLSQAANAGDRLSIRIDLASGGKIGPGKIAVLEQIARTGSISAAGRTLKLSYRQTWDLIDALNRGLGTPVIETAIGGTAGGGAVLTEVGKAVVNTYRAIEVDAAAAARKHLSALTRACPKIPPG
jgi:molybdate transport system regulatory protein